MSRYASGHPPILGNFGALQAVVHKFGLNAAAGTTEETVWTGVAADYHWIATAGTAVIASAAGATDEGVIVNLEGLDAAGLFRTEACPLDATGAVTTTASWLRTPRMYTADNSPAMATGVVTATVDGAVSAHYTVAAQQTQQMIYTIPAGQTGFIEDIHLEVGKGDEARINIRTRASGSVVWRVRDNFHLYETVLTRTHSTDGQTTGIRVESLTDIEVRASSVVGTAEVAGLFHVALYDNV